MLVGTCWLLLFFFFKQKTAYEIYQCDWSSDVCSSDLKRDVVRRPRQSANSLEGSGHKKTLK